MAMLTAYDWPGNVRELKNMLERIAILGTTANVGVDVLPSEVLVQPANQGELPLRLPDEGLQLERLERELVLQALARTKGNHTAAARLLGLSHFQIRSRAVKFGLMS